jgi:hypothetical protein
MINNEMRALVWEIYSCFVIIALMGSALIAVYKINKIVFGDEQETQKKKDP